MILLTNRKIFHSITFVITWIWRAFSKCQSMRNTLTRSGHTNWTRSSRCSFHTCSTTWILSNALTQIKLRWKAFGRNYFWQDQVSQCAGKTRLWCTVATLATTQYTCLEVHLSRLVHIHLKFSKLILANTNGSKCTRITQSPNISDQSPFST